MLLCNILWYFPLIPFSVLQRMTRLLVLTKQMRHSLVNQPPSAVVYWLVFPHQALYGHTQAVTCLAASVSYSIFVSGSDDRTCIIWDLNRLTCINQLPAHEESLRSVAINNSTVRSSFIIFLLMHPWTFHDNVMGAFPNIKTSWESDTLIFFFFLLRLLIVFLMMRGSTKSNILDWVDK